MLVRYKCEPLCDLSVQRLLLKRLQDGLNDESLIFIPMDKNILVNSAICIVKIDTDLSIEVLRAALKIVSITPWFSFRVRNKRHVEILNYLSGPSDDGVRLPGRDLIIDCAQLPLNSQIVDIFPMCESRSYNSVVEIDGYVVKSSEQVEKISEEYYFLSEMNRRRVHLYPRVWDFKLSISSDSAEYKIERIYGSTFSALLLAGGLKAGYLTEFLNQYSEAVSAHAVSSSSTENAADIGRLRMRHERRTAMLLSGSFSSSCPIFFNVDRDEILSLSERVNQICDKLPSDVIGYPLHSRVLHGDMVFSNIMRTLEGSYRCIDPKGLTADRLPFGIYYDFAKILQCLITNYDFWLQGKYLWQTVGSQLFPVDVSDNSRELARIFRDWLSERGFSYLLVKHLCVLHLYALLPLHRENSIRVFAVIRTLRRLTSELDN
jgi:hypothetical protein